MIQKIVCPTDFSSASMNAIEYAARFAMHNKANLTLLHVQSVSIGEGINMFAGDDRESLAESKLAAQQLEDICLDVKKLFRINCDYEIIGTTLQSFVSVIAGESPKYDLTIIGTNGEDSIQQFYFGSHSYRIARKEAGPLIIVPENCAFTEIKNLLYVADSMSPERQSFNQMKNLIDIFHPQIHVLYVNETNNPYSQSVFAEFCNHFEEVFATEKQILFERIKNDNILQSIQLGMQNSKADLVAMYMEEHNVLFSVSHEDVVKAISSDSDFPVLIFHK